MPCSAVQLETCYTSAHTAQLDTCLTSNSHLFWRSLGAQLMAVVAAQIALCGSVETCMSAQYESSDKWQSACLQVSDYYALLREFNVLTPDEDVASVSFMDADYAALRDAAWAAESARDGQAQVT